MDKFKTKAPILKPFICLVTILLFSFSLHSCGETTYQAITDQLIVKGDILKFPSGSVSKSLPFQTSVIKEQVSASIAQEGQKWAKVVVAENEIIVTSTDNTTNARRETILTVIAKNQRQDVVINQEAIDFSGDRQIKVDRATATSELIALDANGEIDPVKSHLAIHMIDGDPSTYHNSKVGAVTDWPFYYDFYFSDVDSINYIQHTSRTDIGINVWGALGEVEVWVATKNKPDLTKYGEYNLEQIIEKTTRLDLSTTAIEPTHIQFRIKSGGNNRVSCAEMQFYETKEKPLEFDYLTVFTDASCSELKAGITEEEVNKISDLFFKNLALSILNGEYNLEYRVREYRPYQHPDFQAKINKTSKYSLKDNPTGIYITEPKKELILFVGDTKKQNLKLNIRDYESGAEGTYDLKEGMNILYPTITGLMYIYNHTEDNIPLILSDTNEALVKAKSVKINIYSGEINGLFDITKHDNKYWDKLLNTYANYDAIDVLGIYSHVAWVTNHYREDKTDIVKMTNYIDGIVYQQWDFMGLFKYNKAFANRQYIRYDKSAPAANASDYRTAYNPNGYRNVFTTEQGFRTRMWVIGHEVGHTNQVRPGVKWAGTTEVTNNLYAMYNQKATLGEAERLTTSKDGYLAGFSKIIDAKNYWFLPEEPNNHIPKVAPFWQLYLYFAEIEGQKDFYKDLYEHFRTTKDITGSNMDENLHRELQFDFIRQVCRIGNKNMLDFFEQWGFLKVGDNTINDYGNKRICITQKQIDDFKAEINAKGYKKPTIEVHRLTDENYKSFKK